MPTLPPKKFPVNRRVNSSTKSAKAYLSDSFQVLMTMLLSFSPGLKPFNSLCCNAGINAHSSTKTFQNVNLAANCNCRGLNTVLGEPNDGFAAATWSLKCWGTGP